MKDEKVFQAVIENYYVDTLEEVLKDKIKQEKREFKTEIL